MSAGVLTVEEVEGIRTRRIADPTVGQVAALAAVFGVSPPTSWTAETRPRLLTQNSVADVRSRLGILAPHLLAINLRNTEVYLTASRRSAAIVLCCKEKSITRLRQPHCSLILDGPRVYFRLHVSHGAGWSSLVARRAHIPKDASP